MSGQLDELAAEARRQIAEVSDLLGGMDDETFSRRPATDRWSVGEQIAHLLRTDPPYLEAMADAIAGAPPARPGREFRGGRVGNWFAGLMEPPPRRRMRTPRELEPAPSLDRQEVLTEFRACREAMLETIRAAEGADLDRATIRSPFFWLLKMPVFSAYAVLLAHGRRHIWLARETLDALSGEASVSG